jgi:hypothetical protein
LSPRTWNSGAPRHGLAIPVVAAVVLVVSLLVIGVGRYQASRIKATGDQVNSFSALEGAQAALHLALAELSRAPAWATHRLELDPATGSFRWAEALPRPVAGAGDPTATGLLSIDGSRSGTVSGRLGSGVFQVAFKVRAARIPLADDASTPAIDEANRYVRIEAIARKTDPRERQDRATRLEAIVERTNFTEYVMYDGEAIVMGMGAFHDRDNVNLVAEGWLYGKNFIHLGNIAHEGTRQAFVNLGRMMSDGPIRTWNPFLVSFQEPRGTMAWLAPENDSRAGARMETAAGNILDGNHRKPAAVPSLDAAFYRRMARSGGIDVSRLPAREDRVTLYPEPPKVHLDFGRAGYTDASGRPVAPVPPDDSAALGADYPADFNGLIYSDKPLAVWGAPDRDVTIFSTGDVYVCGDFNVQTSWRRTPDGKLDWVGPRQNYKPRYEPRGLPPVEGSRYFQYRDADREVYVSPVDPGMRIQDGTEQRKAVAILSMGRIWFDQRHPSRYLANELRPYIKFRIVEALAGEADAYEYVKINGRARPITDVSLKYRGTMGMPLADLFDVRRMVSEDQARTRLYLTPRSYEKVARAFEDVLVRRAATEADRGVVTREKLEGAPASPGLVDVVLAAMIEDEDRFGEFPPASADHPPPLAIWNAPQGLHDLVYDERGSLGPQGHGKYSDWSGDPARAAFADDELFMPQITINAMLVSSAARNDPGRSDDPTDVNRRFDDLGNGLTAGIHFMASQAYLRGDTENVIFPLIQRLVGSDVRLAVVKNRPPALENGYYWPPIRRRIYDASFPFHPPPMLPWRLEVISFKQRGATPGELDRFDR